MTVSMYKLSAPIFMQYLAAQSGCIDKATALIEAKQLDANFFFNMRLAPDMFTYARQVQQASTHAARCCSALAGVEMPDMPNTEASFAELKARLAKTVAYLKTLDPKQIDAAADREITFPLGTNKAEMKGGDYLNHFVLPNFYFHLTAAYAILRHCGVDIGKRDFLGVA